jgi:hypothetical protein
MSGTLVNRLIGRLGRNPHVVHRLDMWTSGVVVFAKSKAAPHPYPRLRLRASAQAPGDADAGAAQSRQTR